jgi:predicted nucleotidyltransferase
MNREELVEIVRGVLPALVVRYGVLHLDLFGSFARGEAGPESDVDFLVTFQREPTFNGTPDRNPNEACSAPYSTLRR